MKNLHNGIMQSITGLLVVIGLAGNAGCASEPPGVEADPVAEAAQAVTSPTQAVTSSTPGIFITTYRDDDGHIVGTCTFTNCPRMPKGTHCTGVKTPIFEVDEDSCDGGPI